MSNENLNEKTNIKMLKKRGRKTLKSHFLLLLLTCLLSAFVGSEFADALVLAEIETTELIKLISLPSDILDGAKEFFSTNRGVLSSIITSFASGTIYDSLISGINTILGTEIAGFIIVITLALLAVFTFWFFIGNVYSVISRRIFLESRTYQKVAAQKFLYLFRVKRWTNVSKVMFVKFILNTLWFCVFIIGGIIKRYSYFLVPYILAENPNISAKEAITLSRNMMNGHKLEAFLLELSFIGWFFLRIVTFGLSGLLYSNAYLIATSSEFYFDIRALSKQSNIYNVELLNDVYLYEKADKSQLEEKYSDIVTILKDANSKHPLPISTAEAFFNTFGITLHRNKGDERREIEAVKEEEAKEFGEILSAEQYPNRLFTLPDRTSGSSHEISNYMIKYTIPTLIMFFFIFSFVGWIWEVMLNLVQNGEFVNRGTMHGPWLPIYGSGGILILTVLYKLRKSAIIQFFSAIVLCGIVEYFTGFALELMSDGTKWWDYSGFFMNLHGRICAEGLIVFGLGGIAVVYALAPTLNNYINKINHKILIAITCILVIIFAFDGLYSLKNPNIGKGITSGQIDSTLEFISNTNPF